MELIGVLMNFISIIVAGDYNPVAFPDGAYEEDSPIYNWAFETAYRLGTIPR